MLRRNPQQGRALSAQSREVSGIVGFNVVGKGGGIFRRATTGPLVIEASGDARLAPLATSLREAGFLVELADDIRPLQRAKLIMNLNNAVGALSDRPTIDLVTDDGYRKVLVAVMGEALTVFRAAALPVGRLGALPARLFPWLLRLPGPLVRVLITAQVKIDPEARSSMWQDLALGRLTEVDYLNGEIVRIATGAGTEAPLNARLAELVHAAEQRGGGSPKLSAVELSAALLRPCASTS